MKCYLSYRPLSKWLFFTPLLPFCRLSFVGLFLMFFLTLSFFSKVEAQRFSTDLWHQGEVYPFQEAPLKGEVRYNFEQNSLILKLDNGTLRSFHASQIEKFFINDALKKQTRYIFSLPYFSAKDPNYQTLHFFELQIEGELNLLSREIFVQDYLYAYNPYFGYSQPYQVLRESQEWFLFEIEGSRLVAFQTEDKNLLREQLLSFMANKKEQVLAFIQEKDLKLQKQADWFALIRYYNTLFEN
ncbi:hypothetical protein [Hugenholtzia roseola]|uniref:hypothetical protein n=1 Tax=Hugenholtzia roseola TaxID=1002 RepID=UPI0003F65554|nr:hypothetical protein [Hugenholtzia roseola]